MRTFTGTLQKEEMQQKYLQLSNDTMAVIGELKDVIKDKTGENLSASEILNAVFTERLEFGPCPADTIQELIQHIKSRQTV